MRAITDSREVGPGIPAIAGYRYHDGRTGEPLQRSSRLKTRPRDIDRAVRPHCDPVLIIKNLFRVGEVDHLGSAPRHSAIVGGAHGYPASAIALLEVPVQACRVPW